MSDWFDDFMVMKILEGDFCAEEVDEYTAEKEREEDNSETEEALDALRNELTTLQDELSTIEFNEPNMFLEKQENTGNYVGFSYSLEKSKPINPVANTPILQPQRAQNDLSTDGIILIATLRRAGTNEPPFNLTVVVNEHSGTSYCSYSSSFS